MTGVAKVQSYKLAPSFIQQRVEERAKPGQSYNFLEFKRN